MLTELISRNEEHLGAVADGNGHALEAENGADEDDEDGESLDEPTATTTRSSRTPSPTTPARSDGSGSGIPPLSGKTIAAGGFVEAARTMGILILTHRRLLVSQFTGDLTTEGYGDRIVQPVTHGRDPLRGNPITIQTYAWFARHVGSLSRTAYQLVICDEAHTALGEKTSAAIRSFPEPIYIGMTATEQLIAKQVSDVFPASVDDLPLGDAARRGLIAPLRCLRVPPAAAISSVPIVGGDYDQEALAKVLDHELINQAAASLYRDRFDATPGIVYAAGVDHAYNLAQEFRAAGPQGRGGQRSHPAGQARGNACGLRARRDQRAHQRPAARRGLELAARERLHASCTDREPPRVPAAHRPNHAHPAAEGSRHRRRLRRSCGDTHGADDHASFAARLRFLPPGCARDPGAEAARSATNAAQALPGQSGSFPSPPIPGAASP